MLARQPIIPVEMWSHPSPDTVLTTPHCQPFFQAGRVSRHGDSGTDWRRVMEECLSAGPLPLCRLKCWCVEYSPSCYLTADGSRLSTGLMFITPVRETEGNRVEEWRNMYTLYSLCSSHSVVWLNKGISNF